MQIQGVTRPEALGSDWGAGAAQQMMSPQPVMAAKFMRAESAAVPVEGDEKSVTATVQVKIRF